MEMKIPKPPPIVTQIFMCAASFFVGYRYGLCAVFIFVATIAGFLWIICLIWDEISQ